MKAVQNVFHHHDDVATTESLFRTRMNQLRAIATKVIMEIKQRADNSFKEMDDKLGERFLREMGAIKALSTYIKSCIEHREKIKRQLILDQDEFVIADVMKIKIKIIIISINSKFVHKNNRTLLCIGIRRRRLGRIRSSTTCSSTSTSTHCTRCCRR